MIAPPSSFGFVSCFTSSFFAGGGGGVSGGGSFFAGGGGGVSGGGGLKFATLTSGVTTVCLISVRAILSQFLVVIVT